MREDKVMTITKNAENGVVTLNLAGRLDTTTAPELEAAIDGCIRGASELTLDLAELDYISSAGLRVLLKAQKIMNTQGIMRVIHVGEPIMEIFEITGFVDILTIE